MTQIDNDGTFAVARYDLPLPESAISPSPFHRVSSAEHAPPENGLAAGKKGMDSLIRHYARTQDPEARKILILHHQKLVYYAAARFGGGAEALEDLVQVGMIGLINAIDRYDPGKDVRFSTYALPTIIGEIKRYFRDKTWAVKVPRWLQELSLNARKIQHTLQGRLGRSPSVREIAHELGVSEDDALEALEITHIASAVSLDTHLDSSAEGPTLLDVLGRSDGALHDIDAYSDLRRALDVLGARERQVIHLRFFEELSQAKIARALGVSQMHVSRLQQRALQRLRGLLAEGDGQRRSRLTRSSSTL